MGNGDGLEEGAGEGEGEGEGCGDVVEGVGPSIAASRDAGQHSMLAL